MKSNALIVCVDANVYISGIAFGGKPAQIIDLALSRKFFLITSSPILNEVQRNLTSKIGLDKSKVSNFLDKIRYIATMYEPTGNTNYISHKQDNLVLETALLGNAQILVTGDKKDLLPLKTFHGIVIEPPSAFIERLKEV